MNRIRHAYLQITPEVEPYLVMGAHDDEQSINLSMGTPPNTNFVLDILVSTPFVLATINSVIGGVIAVLLAQQLGVDTAVAVVLTIVGVALVFGLQVLVATRGIAASIAGYTPKFPTPAARGRSELRLSPAWRDRSMTHTLGTLRADAASMDAARLQRRILVVLVTTRAAVSSLGPGDGQIQSAVRRGIQLLDGMADEVTRDGDAATNERLAQARRELESLLGDGSS